MIDDINSFISFVHKHHGFKISVKLDIDGDINRDNVIVDRWATAVSRHFKCSKDVLFRTGRKNNAFEKMWLQYFLMDYERLPPTKMYKMFGLRDHASLCINRNSVKGYSSAYPEIYNGILKKYKNINRNNNRKIKITYNGKRPKTNTNKVL